MSLFSILHVVKYSGWLVHVLVSVSQMELGVVLIAASVVPVSAAEQVKLVHK